MPRLTKEDQITPYSCVVFRPDDAVAYFEAYKNIGRKYTHVKGSDLARTVLQAGIDATPKGARMEIKRGLYPLGTEQLTRSYDKPIQIIGEGQPYARETDCGVVLTYSGDDYALRNTGYPVAPAQEKSYITIKRLAIHTTGEPCLGGLFVEGVAEIDLEWILCWHSGVYKVTDPPAMGIRLWSRNGSWSRMKHCGADHYRYGIYIGQDTVSLYRCSAQNCYVGFANSAYEEFGVTPVGHHTIYEGCQTIATEWNSFSIRGRCTTLINPICFDSALGGDYFYVQTTGGVVIVNPRFPDYNSPKKKIKLIGGYLEVVAPCRDGVGEDFDMWGYLSRSTFQATILNGQTSVTVDHGCIVEPTIVVALGRDADTSQVRCSARTATQITLTVPAVVGGDRVIDVICDINAKV